MVLLLDARHVFRTEWRGTPIGASALEGVLVSDGVPDGAVVMTDHLHVEDDKNPACEINVAISGDCEAMPCMWRGMARCAMRQGPPPPPLVIRDGTCDADFSNADDGPMDQRTASSQVADLGGQQRVLDDEAVVESHLVPGGLTGVLGSNALNGCV